MTRRLPVLTILSLLLAGAVCVMWMRSYRMIDNLRLIRQVYLASVSGDLMVVSPIPPPSQSERVQSDRPFGPRWRSARYDWTGEQKLYMEWFKRTEGWLGFVLGPTDFLDSRYHVIAPYWAFAAFFAFLPAWRGIRAGARTLRAARRRSLQLCPACGYDLRATPEQCPECGMAVTAETQR